MRWKKIQQNYRLEIIHKVLFMDYVKAGRGDLNEQISYKNVCVVMPH